MKLVLNVTNDVVLVSVQDDNGNRHPISSLQVKRIGSARDQCDPEPVDDARELFRFTFGEPGTYNIVAHLENRLLGVFCNVDYTP